MTARLHEDIARVLQKVAERGDFVAAIYEGLLGDKDDGVYPGRGRRPHGGLGGPRLRPPEQAREIFSPWQQDPTN